MRLVFIGSLVLAALPGVAVAQNGPQNGMPDCYCAPPPCYRPAPQPAPAPQGAFVAPPYRGDVASEHESVGVHLGTVRIPEINIPLPTIQFPSVVRYRRDAEMLTESARAPYVQQPQMELRYTPQPVQQAPAPAAPVPPACCPSAWPNNTTVAPPNANVTPPPAPAATVSQVDLEQELDAKAEQVDQLQGKVEELQMLCEQLATAQMRRLKEDRIGSMRRRLESEETADEPETAYGATPRRISRRVAPSGTRQPARSSAQARSGSVQRPDGSRTEPAYFSPLRDPFRGKTETWRQPDEASQQPAADNSTASAGQQRRTRKPTSDHEAQNLTRLLARLQGDNGQSE